MDVLGKMGGPMNEAQKKLYKKLLKSLDQQSEDESLAEMASTSMSPAEMYARKLELERKGEEIMRAKAARRLEKKKAKEEEALKIKLEAIRRKKHEEQKKKVEAAEAKVREIEVKTHKFFRLNKYGKGIMTGVVYFGDTINVNDAWVPHGFGEYKVNGEVLYEGDFSRGKMHGKGIYLFANGNIWRGTFRFDELHGVGMLEEADSNESFHANDNGNENKNGGDDSKGDRLSPKECIFYKNKRICFTDELLPGVHIIFLGSSFHSPGATLLGRTKKSGHFRVKMDVGGIQNVNLAEEAFKIDIARPRVTLLENYVDKKGENGATNDGTFAEKRYNFEQDLESPTYTEHEENVSENLSAAASPLLCRCYPWQIAFCALTTNKSLSFPTKTRSAFA